MQFCVLGPVEVRDDNGAKVDIGGDVPATLLALLLVEGGQPLARRDLERETWFYRDPKPVTDRVKTEISLLRGRLQQGLGERLIETVRDGYRLSVLDVSASRYDVARYRVLIEEARISASSGDREAAHVRYTQAESLWRGEPFAGLATPRLEDEVHALGELRAGALADRIDLELDGQRGVSPSLLAELEHLTVRYPGHERFWQQRMRALAASDRRADALRVADEARRVLRREEGLEPGRGLADLEERIRAGEDVTRVSGVCPYKGLQPFQPEDAGLFFGRRTLQEELLARVAASRLLTVVGRSGSGKSSLVRAGLIAAFQQHAGTRVLLLTPGEHPAAALHGRLQQQDDETTELLIVVDQAEELFSVCLDEQERSEFGQILRSLLDRPTPVARVVLVVRSDFLGTFTEWRALGERWAPPVVVRPLEADGLRAAVERPAGEANLTLEPGLVDLVLADAATSSSALPLVSHALYETWRRRRGNTLTIEGYRAVGGVRGAIEDTAEAVLSGFSEFESQRCLDLLVELVEPGDEVADTRRSRTMSQLIAGVAHSGGEASANTTGWLVERLVAARLVVIDRDHVELAHEALLDSWPRLRFELDRRREDLLFQRELDATAARWTAADRDATMLWRGPRLQRALALSAPSPAETSAFVLASDRARRRARTARRVGVLWACVGGLAVALVTGALSARWLDRRAEQSAVAGARAASVSVATEGGAVQLEQKRVSVFRYRDCVRFKACSPVAEAQASTNGTALITDTVDVALSRITLAQAFDFCHWIGRRLPLLRELIAAQQENAADLSGRGGEWTATVAGCRSTTAICDAVWSPRSKNVLRVLVLRQAPSGPPVPIEAAVDEAIPLVGFRCAS